MHWHSPKNPELSGFVRAFNLRHKRVSQIIYCVLIVAMLMFGLWDVNAVGIDHPALPDFLWTRFWMTIPILFLALFASFDNREELRFDWHMTLACLAIGLCVIQMYYLFHNIGRQITIDGLILFSVGVYFIPSMFPHQKLLIGLVSLAGYYIFLYHIDRDLEAFVHATVYLGLLNVAGAIHSVSFDRSIKQNYLNNKALAKIAQTDQLTGVDNRYHFDERFTGLIEQAQSEGCCLFLAIVDIDHFKQFNDRYGHLEGDNCLVSVSTALRVQCEGEQDQCIRFGGEEFILVKYGLSEAKLVDWCHKILDGVAGLRIKHELSSTAEYVTVSIGATVWRPDCGLNRAELMSRADEALYRAKSDGRNQVVIA